MDAVPDRVHLDHLQRLPVLTMEKLLTLKQVSELLGSRDPKGRLARNLRSQGILEAAKFGRVLMFKESSVRAYIESQFALQNPKGKKKGCPEKTSKYEHSTVH